MVSNRFPVTSCVTQATLATGVIHVSAQVTSNTCGAHLGGVLLSFPPKLVGLAPLAGTRGRTMIGGCWKAVIKSQLVHSALPQHTVSWTKEFTSDFMFNLNTNILYPFHLLGRVHTSSEEFEFYFGNETNVSRPHSVLVEFENAFNHRPLCIGVWVKLGQGNVTVFE